MAFALFYKVYRFLCFFTIFGHRIGMGSKGSLTLLPFTGLKGNIAYCQVGPAIYYGIGLVDIDAQARDTIASSLGCCIHAANGIEIHSICQDGIAVA